MRQAIGTPEYFGCRSNAQAARDWAATAKAALFEHIRTHDSNAIPMPFEWSQRVLSADDLLRELTASLRTLEARDLELVNATEQTHDATARSLFAMVNVILPFAPCSTLERGEVRRRLSLLGSRLKRTG